MMFSQVPQVTSKHDPEQLFLTSCVEKSSIPPTTRLSFVGASFPALIKIVARAWRSFLAIPQRVSVSPPLPLSQSDNPDLVPHPLSTSHHIVPHHRNQASPFNFPVPRKPRKYQKA